MGLIKKESIEQLLERIDIVSLIETYVPLKRAGSSFKGLCPFHNEKSPSFSVSPQRQRYHCFGCGASGSSVNFLMEYTNITYPEALRQLADKYGMTLEEETDSTQSIEIKKQRNRLLLLHELATAWFHELLLTHPDAKGARDYLKQRGLNSTIAKQWLLGWAPTDSQLFLNWAKEQKLTGRELIDSGLAALKDPQDKNSGLYSRFRNRLMFPICNDYGEPIAFSARQLDNNPNTGKYINSPETSLFVKSKNFYGLDKAKRAIGQNKYALLCEGQMDVIAAHQAGFEMAVASLGTAFTEQHATLIKRYSPKAKICFDADGAGQKAAIKAYAQLAAIDVKVDMVQLPNGEDPDSIIKSKGKEAFAELVDEALPFFEDQLQKMQAHPDWAKPQKKMEFVSEFLYHLSHLTHRTEQDIYLSDFCTRLNLDPEAIRQDFNTILQQKKQQDERDQQRQKQQYKLQKQQEKRSNQNSTIDTTGTIGSAATTPSTSISPHASIDDFNASMNSTADHSDYSDNSNYSEHPLSEESGITQESDLNNNPDATHHQTSHESLNKSSYQTSPPPIDSALQTLVQAALQDSAAQAWLIEQLDFYQAHIDSHYYVKDFIKILTEKPDPYSAPSLNGFLAQFDAQHPFQNITNQATLRLAEQAAKESHTEMQRRLLNVESNRIQMRLNDSSLSAEQQRQLMQEFMTVNEKITQLNS